MAGIIEKVWHDIEAWLHQNAPDRAKELLPGAKLEQLQSLEATLGIHLPEDYSKSLQTHDGEAYLSDYSYLSIGTATESWISLNEQEDEGTFKGRSIDNPDAGIIQPTWWCKAWFPFAKDSGGNLLCVDLRPGPNGSLGQVVRFERSMGPGPTEWKSFGEWLTAYRDGLRDGTYVADPDGFIQEAG